MNQSLTDVSAAYTGRTTDAKEDPAAEAWLSWWHQVQGHPLPAEASTGAPAPITPPASAPAYDPSQGRGTTQTPSVTDQAWAIIDQMSTTKRDRSIQTAQFMVAADQLNK